MNCFYKCVLNEEQSSHNSRLDPFILTIEVATYFAVEGAIGYAAAEGDTVETSSLEMTHARTMGGNAFRRFAADIKNNGIKESIKYVEHNGKRYVVDGNHRLAAARLAGMSEVPAEGVELPYNGFETPDDLAYTYY